MDRLIVLFLKLTESPVTLVKKAMPYFSKSLLELASRFTMNNKAMKQYINNYVPRWIIIYFTTKLTILLGT